MPSAKSSSYYRDRPVALLTRHNKAVDIAPALAALGLEVRSTDAFDTDSLGTFSGETPRTLSPLECARRKAHLACELTGLSLGLGSEGSFGGGPLPGLLNWDDELLVLVDVANDNEIVASASGPVRLSQFTLESLADLEQRLAPFEAQQGWILRLPDRVLKGLVGVPQISAELEQLALLSAEGNVSPKQRGRITIEPDLRAMHCPQRRAIIRRAAEQLAQRLQALCPACSAPDFWRREVERGLPCAWCGEPTEMARAFISRCPQCGHEQRDVTDADRAEPGHCNLCNP